MDIQRLTLKGFVGVKKGLDLDEITVDFSEMKALVALAGPTGAGKTTIMENLQPYPQLVSRPEKTLKNHVFLRDSVKELSFIHDGSFFETLVKVDAESGRSEGFIYVNGASVVNGKITEYTKYLQEIFGTPNLFFNSVFCAQNSARISSLRPAELKALFTEFLGERLAKLVEYETAAKQIANVLSGKRQAICSQVEMLSARLQSKDQVADQLAALRKEAASRSEQLDDLQLVIASTTSDLQMLENLSRHNALLQQKMTDLQERLQTLNKEEEQIRIDHSKITSDLQKAQGALTADIAAQEKILADENAILEAVEQRKNLEVKVEQLHTGLQALMQQRADKSEAVRIAEKVVAEHNLAVKAKAHEVEMAAGQIAREAADIEVKIFRITTQQSSLPTETAALEDKARALSEKASELERRGSDLTCSCGQSFACNSQNCAFIESALRAKKELPDIQRRLKESKAKISVRLELLSSERAKLEKRLDDLQAERTANIKHWENQAKPTLIATGKRLFAEVETAKAAINKLNAASEQVAWSLNGCKKDLAEASRLAARAPEITAARAKLEHLEKALEEHRKKIEEEDRRIITKHQAAFVKIDEVNAQVRELDSQIDETLAGKVSQTKDLLEDHQTRLARIQAELARVQERIARTEAELSALDEAEIELTVLQEQERKAAAEISEWSYLREACGADGLRALEIDSVAPSIAADANMLLEQALGAWAMVDFRTQDETGREVLEPRVIDGDGDSVLIANRSGGQQVWALKALRLAMTLISKEKSGKDYKTAYADEDDAGLDIETAQAYTKLYKAFMGHGGFSKCFFISHKPECVSLADHVLRLGKGAVWIER